MRCPYAVLALSLLLTNLATAGKPKWYQEPGNWFRSVFSGLEKGSRAPRIVAVDAAGNRYDGSVEKEGFLLVSFWASWCPPCHEELPLLAKVSEERPHLKVLAVNVHDDSAAARKYAERSGLKLAFLFDDQEKTARAYSISSIPVNYLLKAETFEILDKWVGSGDLAALESHLSPVPYGE